MPRWHILISSGPTREAIDPVRFLSNRSSGRMGHALAKAARALGYRVTLVSGPVTLPAPSGVRVMCVESAAQMRQAMRREARKADLVIMAAAVADYAPVKIASQKIKKTSSTLVLRLKKTPDILKELGRHKPRKQILVGFAAETQSLRKHALGKLKSKNLDYIVANPVGKPGSGFDSTHNTALLLGRDGSARRFARMTKDVMARKLLKIFTLC